VNAPVTLPKLPTDNEAAAASILAEVAKFRANLAAKSPEYRAHLQRWIDESHAIAEDREELLCSECGQEFCRCDDYPASSERVSPSELVGFALPDLGMARMGVRL
jgi:hypothetical protein